MLLKRIHAESLPKALAKVERECGRDALLVETRQTRHGAEMTFGPDPDLMVMSWYLEALIHRYRVGDMRCELRLRQFWEGPGVMVPELRARMARAFLLQDVPPSEEAKTQWVGRMLRELERPDASMMSHILARSYRLRTGVEGAREKIVGALRAAGKAFEADPENIGELTHPFIEALRAL